MQDDRKSISSYGAKIARVYVLVILLLMNWIFIFVCVYFLYCDTLKMKNNKNVSSIFSTLAKFLKWKNLKTPPPPKKKKTNEIFLRICASTQYVHHNYKVSRNFVEHFQPFQRSCADNEKTQIWRTDQLTLYSTTRCVGYN